ncbi:MAG: FAD-dependent oxidoreductase, partial [Actinomycetota bacterium]|nr:FAD-dependent oxidoreductase [Actinomycetota bacterium]
NQFHYYRLTADNRILWGGYDATYHWSSRIDPSLDDRPETHNKLAHHFFETFPQLEGLTFTHRWGGPIATTTRFTASWGIGSRGDVAWVGGYTGLGIGASRFGARVALDLVDGRDTERTALSMVQKPPIPFPPEPLRSFGVSVTKRAIQRQDRRGGRQGAWLSLLNRFGVGFSS